MGRTYKRNMDDDWFDASSSNEADDEDDLLDWMARPNEAHAGIASKVSHHSGAGRPPRRGLLDDWRNLDFGDDPFEMIRR